MRSLSRLLGVSYVVASISCGAPSGVATPSVSIAVPETPRADAVASAPEGDTPRGAAGFGDAYPAGLCGFEPYLSSVCGDVGPPAYAVVLDEIFYFTDASSTRRDNLLAVKKPPPEHFFELAERSLAKAEGLGLAPGFPFVATYDEMPAADPERRGGAVVAGLFASEEGARRLVAEKKLEGARIVALATNEVAVARWRAAAGGKVTSRPAKVAVQIALATAAYREADIAALETALSNRSHESYAALLEQRAAGVAALKPACSLSAGRVFSVEGAIVDRFSRAFAPVQCGRDRAWVPWSTTRLDSVVTVAPPGPRLHQIVLVECDVPTLTSRALSSPIAVLPREVGCPG